MMNTEEISALLDWYESAKRDLPWRKTQDSYRIWVSEIMLQQTRVEAVKPYYAAFLDKYPDVSALADAREDDLIRIWEGLGYYSRVRNMHKAAMDVKENHGGLFPVSYEVLLTLPGIGEYTAGAVSSIAGGENVPAVDGNVLRVYTRLTADAEEITNPKVVKRIRRELKEAMDKAAGNPDMNSGNYSPGKFNSAMMELGATICLPNGDPKCSGCPLGTYCLAYRNNAMTEFPKKSAKTPRKIEKRTIFIMESTGGIALRKRPDKGLLAGMYEFPGINGHLDQKQAKKFLSDLGYHPVKITRIEDAKHIFSHIEWHMRAYYAVIDEITDPVKEDEANRIRFVTKKERADGYALPSAFSAYKKYF